MRPGSALVLGSLLAPEVVQAAEPAAIAGLELVISPGKPWGFGAALEGGILLASGPPGFLSETFLGFGAATELGWTAAVGTRAGASFGDPCQRGGIGSTNAQIAGEYEVAAEAAMEFSTARPLAFRPGLHLRGLGIATTHVRTRTTAGGLGRTSVGVGIDVHYPAWCYTFVGRPVRGQDGAPVLPGAVGGERTWRERGRGEQASIAAFRRLAAELAQVGAPAGLVARAREAAREEARHALLSYALASRTGPVWVGATPGWSRRPGGRAGLVRLAVESLREGVIDEARGAHDAAIAAERSGDPVERVVEASLAVEEARHAALAEDVVAWAQREGGRAVVEAVRAVERSA